MKQNQANQQNNNLETNNENLIMKENLIMNENQQTHILETHKKVTALNESLKNFLSEARLELGIDQLTMVAFPNTSLFNKEDIIFEWDEIAEKIISTIEEKTNLVNTFGERIKLKKAINGYNTAYQYGTAPNCVTIYYNDSRPDMAVMLYYSGQGLKTYLNKNNIQVYNLIQNIQDELYTIRLSRIDLVADFINYGLDITKIYNDYVNNETNVFLTVYREDNSQFYKKGIYEATNYTKESNVRTMYLGTRKSEIFLRVYNKKLEQMDKGVNSDKVLNCADWVRFECETKGKSAHQMSQELLNIKSDEELAHLIANTFLQKYSFFYMEDNRRVKPTEYTQAIIDCVTENKCILSSAKPMNYDLVRTFQYLFSTSGMIPAFYKVLRIYGEQGLKDLSDYIREYVHTYEPTKKCFNWIEANKDILLENEPDFRAFLEKTVDM